VAGTVGSSVGAELVAAEQNTEIADIGVEGMKVGRKTQVQGCHTHG
jgi:hypothetical protein